jgi:PAS domain S-box-containing protein
MNEKKQAITLLSLVLAILAALFLSHVQQLENRIADLTIEGEARELNSTIQTLQKYSYAKYGERIKNLLIADPRIVEAFAQRDRNRLLAVARVKYDSLRRENPYFHIMQFHLPDSTIFLRMHQPELFGDAPAEKQAMAATTHRNHQPVAGFGFCRDGLFFRVIQPVFAGTRYVGAMEFGIRAHEVIAAIQENLQTTAIPFFRAEQWQEASGHQDRPHVRKGDFVVLTDDSGLLDQLPLSFYDTDEDQIISHQGQSFRVHNHPIFKDQTGNSIGGLILLQDISTALARKHDFFRQTVLLVLLLFVGSATLLYVSFEKVLRSLTREVRVRQEKEAALRDREQRIRLLLDSTAEGIFGLDNEGRCTFVNRACLTLLGYQEDTELLGRTLHDLIHYRKPDGSEFPMADCPMCRSYHGGQEVSIDDEVLWRKDGRAIPVAYHAYPVHQEDRLLGSVVSFADITRRKQAEFDRERLAAAIEHAADEIIITDTNGCIEYVNPAFERVTGYSRHEVLGKTPSVLKSGSHSEQFYRNLWETISAGLIWSDRIINKTKEGALIEEDATISPIFDGNGRSMGYVAVKRDITARVRMEERLRQATKMESLGTLAGAIAHDFNNILNAIIGLTSLTLREQAVQGKIADNLHEIEAAGETAKELVRQILAFTRKESAERKALRVQNVAQEVVKLLRSTLPQGIVIKEEIDHGCPPIWGNSSQMHQIIMNLAVNAAHAMQKQGGELSVIVKEDRASRPVHGPQRLVRLVVSDTGGGIHQADLDHIFDPYFTTKKEGEGTGLGLATVRTIVSEHKGSITVQSTVGQGTTFTLTFPAQESTGVTTEQQKALPPLPELSGRILFVDDAAVNVMLGRDILQAAGCTVSAFTDSVLALESFRQRPADFDLVVTDQSMPVLTGAQLAREVKMVRHDIPIVMVTGHDDPAHDEALNQCGITEFLTKPISVAQLLAVAENLMRPDLRPPPAE